MSHTGWLLKNVTESILGTWKHLRRNPRTRQYLIQGEIIFA